MIKVGCVSAWGARPAAPGAGAKVAAGSPSPSPSRTHFVRVLRQFVHLLGVPGHGAGGETSFERSAPARPGPAQRQPRPAVPELSQTGGTSRAAPAGRALRAAAPDAAGLARRAGRAGPGSHHRARLGSAGTARLGTARSTRTAPTWAAAALSEPASILILALLPASLAAKALPGPCGSALRRQLSSKCPAKSEVNFSSQQLSGGSVGISQNELGWPRRLQRGAVPLLPCTATAHEGEHRGKIPIPETPSGVDTKVFLPNPDRSAARASCYTLKFSICFKYTPNKTLPSVIFPLWAGLRVLHGEGWWGRLWDAVNFCGP